MSLHNTNTHASGGVIGASLIAGFLGAVGALVAWFATHVPIAGMGEGAARAAIGLVWFGALVVGLVWAGRGRQLRAGLGAGLVSGLLGAALIGGTKTKAAVEVHAAATGSEQVGLSVIMLGFVLFGVVLGALAGVVAPLIRREVVHLNRPSPSLARFAMVTAAAVAPLLFIGGLVTSTDSGMAVPDWPTTFGSAMLAYPLGTTSPEDVFLEHSHRLFGMLVGFASLTLLVWVLATGVRGWARTVAIVAFVLVCTQGVIGGVRVRADSRLLAMVHGVLAQGVFAVVIALAAYLSPSFRESAIGYVDAAQARKLKRFATSLVHVLVLQLLLGAVTRHFRKTDHTMWLHAAVSLGVVAVAAMVGFAAAALPRSAGGGVAALRRCGPWLVAVVTVQFLLGWATFLVRGKEIKAAGMLEALIRTAHQANGAMLLGVAACAFVWARWLWRGVRVETTGPEGTGGAGAAKSAGSAQAALGAG